MAPIHTDLRVALNHCHTAIANDDLVGARRLMSAAIARIDAAVGGAATIEPEVLDRLSALEALPEGGSEPLPQDVPPAKEAPERAPPLPQEAAPAPAKEAPPERAPPLPQEAAPAKAPVLQEPSKESKKKPKS